MADFPLPKFFFEVDLGPELNKASFTEVSGLETDTDPITYRHGRSPSFHPIKMPGLGKVGNVILKRGIIRNIETFKKWHEKKGRGDIKRRTVIIKLLDENGEVKINWELKNAYCTKISFTELKSDDNEVAIETLELVHEGLTFNE